MAPTTATAVAAPAPAATEAASAATGAASAPAAVLAWLGLVDGKAAAIDLFAVHCRDGAWASWSVFISTKPNRLDRPVSRSMMTWADSTLPCGANIWSSVLFVTP